MNKTSKSDSTRSWKNLNLTHKTKYLKDEKIFSVYPKNFKEHVSEIWNFENRQKIEWRKTKNEKEFFKHRINFLLKTEKPDQPH